MGLGLQNLRGGQVFCRLSGVLHTHGAHDQGCGGMGDLPICRGGLVWVCGKMGQVCGILVQVCGRQEKVCGREVLACGSGWLAERGKIGNQSMESGGGRRKAGRC